MKDSRSAKGLLLFLTGILFFILAPGLFPDEPIDIFLTQASQNMDGENYQTALVLYMKALPRLSELSETARSRILNNIGFCAFKTGDLSLAESYYRQALELDGDYVTCLNNIGALLMGQVRYREAAVYLKRADAKEDRNIKVIFNLAVCAGRLKNESDLLLYMKRAFELNESYTYQRLRKNNIGQREIKLLKAKIAHIDRNHRSYF